MTEQPSASDETGYRKPPAATRFRKGQSGNPRGRPKGRRSDVPYDHLLGQMVVVRENGRERRVTAAEAFLLHLTKRGMEGDSASARASLAAIEEARARRQVGDLPNFLIVWKTRQSWKCRNCTRCAGDGIQSAQIFGTGTISAQSMDRAACAFEAR